MTDEQALTAKLTRSLGPILKREVDKLNEETKPADKAA
jgi:hypothetical protein